MEYLRIEEDGSLNQVKGKDPLQDDELMQEVMDGTLAVVRYRGNDFESLSVDGDDGDEDKHDWNSRWDPV